MLKLTGCPIMGQPVPNYFIFYEKSICQALKKFSIKIASEPL